MKERRNEKWEVFKCGFEIYKKKNLFQGFSYHDSILIKLK